MTLDILAIAVHPDDTELSCSGTLLKQIDLGNTVGLIDLTQGELGTRGSGPLRLEEAEEARKLMGAAVRENLGMADGFFAYTKENLLKIVGVIRKYQPKVVLANTLRDRHPDHGRASKLISDACFYSGLIKIETNDDAGNTQAPWRPKAVYHFIQDYQLEPDFVVDISGYMEKKMEVIMAFKSQFYSPDSEEPETPISRKDFMDFIYSKARVFGRPIGAEFGGGYKVTRTVGVKDIMELL